SSSSEVADNQDILTSSQSSQGDSSTSDTSIDVSTSEPTPDTHEPTSQPTSSSSNSKPTGETSTPTTSKPTSSSSSSGGNTSTPTSPYWNPNAPGNKPGPYGGYYDASGTLHVLKANMPKDSEGYPLKSYTDEVGQPRLSKDDKEAARAEEERIANGGGRGAGEAEITEEGLASWGW
ncbi:MAG: hypothetical protein MSR67_01255, partial [Oscillospiraceae bacterium]|nr:hypothetical protein [Oscillospiraceae bacterium]